MIIMHGMFDLADGVGESEFGSAFERLGEHMQAHDLVVAHRFMKHKDHDGYNAGAPSTHYYVAVEFSDMEAAQRCWDRIQEGAEPLKSLHAAVFSKVQNSSFFLSADV